MAALKLGFFSRLFAPRRNAVLASSLAKHSDQDIDAALKQAGLTRAQLFGAARATARHRVHMSSMMVALKVDAREAVEHHWPQLKEADDACARCVQVGRCQRWLEWGWYNGAQKVFCPNAELFEQIAKAPSKPER